MRATILLCALLVCGGLAAVDQKPVRYVGRESPYPLWDGKESVAEYARRTGLDRGGPFGAYSTQYFSRSYDRIIAWSESFGGESLRVLMDIPLEWDRHVKK